ncbi:ATP-dependent DNA helicase RecG [Halocola ammonii]
MQSFLETPIEFLTGVGPQRAKALQKELQIFTFLDLLNYFPFRYIDKSTFHKTSEISSDAAYVQLKGKLVRVQQMGDKRKKRLIAVFSDGHGTIDLVWFKGIRFIMPKLRTGVEYIVFGKPNKFKNKWSIPHPELNAAADATARVGGSLKPVYGTTEKLSGMGLNSNGIERLAKSLVAQLNGKVSETLPSMLRAEHQLMGREEAYRNVHFPQSTTLLEGARNRLKFEELFMLQLIMLRNKSVLARKLQGFVFERVGDFFHEFYEKHIPFELTGAQKRVLKEIRFDMKRGVHMNRLLQGDVGSGKTLVALLSMLIAVDNGFQACMMAPTEILATQHYETIRELVEPLGMSVRLLTGSTKKSERTELHQKLCEGEIDILLGTHALIEPTVEFKNLGLAVIDEQHRFGVAQRSKLWRKNTLPPHVLVMTATPIPRTLAMTLYGDLDVSVIDELPPGRKPIKTIHRNESSRGGLFFFLQQEIDKGRQVYIVYPLIEESAALDLKHVMDGFESIEKRFPKPKYHVSIVHGKMKPADKDFEMQRFVKGETQLMVATTVIEVGVNVPNASVMVIENSERFGLSQLHQLRGRVGRGAEQSYCILMTAGKLGNDARKRIKTMVESNDGFKISEVDLEIRGPGEMTGTRQSGTFEFNIADLTTDREILIQARKSAVEILEKDEELNRPENRELGAELRRIQYKKPNWGRIS